MIPYHNQTKHKQRDLLHCLAMKLSFARKLSFAIKLSFARKFVIFIDNQFCLMYHTA